MTTDDELALLRTRVQELENVVARLTTASGSVAQAQPAEPVKVAPAFDRRAFLRRAVTVGGVAAAGGALALSDASPAAASTGQSLIIGSSNVPSTAADPPTRLYNPSSTDLSPTLLKIDNYSSNLLSVPGNTRLAIVGTVSGQDSGGSGYPKIGVYGATDSGTGVSGVSSSGTGVSGVSSTGTGVSGSSTASNNPGVYGTTTGATTAGVQGYTEQSGGSGVLGQSTDGTGVKAAVEGSGIAMQAFQDGSGGAFLAKIDSSGNTSTAARIITLGTGEATYASADSGIAGRFDGLVSLRLHTSATSGPPTDTSIASAVGDVKSFEDGLWLCVDGGTPGSWLKLGGAASAGAFHAITPARVYDSRIVAPRTPIAKNTTRAVSVANAINGSGGVATANVVPAGATAISFNLTIVSTVGAGHLTLYPADKTQPSSSSINWTAANQTIANGVVCPISADRKIAIYASNQTHALIDVNGYYL